jgi:hypothetical protein
MKKLLVYIALLLCVLFGMVFSFPGCNGDDEFKIVSFTSNVVTATVGTQITLSWGYQEEGELTNQKLIFLKETFQGISREEYSLDRSQRSYNFTFSGPRTIMLEAQAEEGQDNAALTIYIAQNFYLRMTTTNDYPDYPFLGAANADGSISHEFTSFFAFYNEREQDCVVDDLRTILSPQNFFRAYSFSPFEQNNFGLREGSMFPTVMNNPQAGCANVILFGGKIATDGKPQKYQAKDGEGTSYVGVTRYERIFISIALFVGFSSTPSPSACIDIALGNLEQGLVTPANYNDLGSTTRCGEYELNWQNRGTQYGSIRGYFKGTVVGNYITLQNGDLIYAIVHAPDIQFDMPFLPDTKIDDFIQ